jgi:uroporphyrinogen-III synthase
MAHRTTAEQRVLFPCGRPVSDALVDGLVGQGLSVEKVTVYEAQADPAAAERVRELLAEPVDAITFASSASVSHFLDASGAEGRQICATSRVVAIGPVTAQAAQALGLRVDAVAEHASMAAMIEALVGLVGA